MLAFYIGLCFRFNVIHSPIRLMVMSDSSFEVENGARQLNIQVYDPINQRQSPLDYMAQVNVLFENMTIRNIYGTNNGGGVHFLNYGWVDPMITVRNSTFDSCGTTKLGGSMYFEGAKSLFITNTSIFKGNSTHGGGSYVKNITTVNISNTMFQGSTTVSSNGGGFYGIIISTLSFERTIFSDCLANGGNGGGIYADTISTYFYINECLFSSLKSTASGGAILISPLCPAVVSQSIFYNCSSANNGGGIFINPTSTTDLKGLCFFGCFATGSSSYHGTTIYFSSSNTQQLSLNLTSINSCGSKSHMVSGNYLGGGTQTLTSINLTLCAAYSSSSFYTLPRGPFFIQYSTIYNSSSAYSYDVYATPNGATSISFFYCNCINNSVGSSGYMFQINEANQKTLFQFCVFLNNICHTLIYSSSTCSIKSSVARHSYTFANSFIGENYVSITGNTNTYLLNHFSTNYCQTPPELAPQELVCQTLMPTPTACIFPSDQTAETQLSLSTLLHFISLSLPIFY